MKKIRLKNVMSWGVVDDDVLGTKAIDLYGEGIKGSNQIITIEVTRDNIENLAAAVGHAIYTEQERQSLMLRRVREEIEEGIDE